MDQRHKKHIVFAGNCNASDLARFFSGVGALEDEFEFHCLAFHLTPAPTPAMMAIVASAHAVFVQGIAEAEQFERTSVPSSVRRIGYPNLLRRAFWPFDGLVFGRDALAEADAAKGGPVRFTDGVLARLRDEVPDQEERFVAYRNLKARGVNKDFPRLLELEDAMMMNIDDAYACDLGRFVRENATTRQLFHWLGHPSGLLYRELMVYCCDRLGVDIDLPDPGALDGWGTMQVPVHPMVAERLGLEWAAPDRRYHYAPTGHPTWEEYTRMYIRQLG